MRLEKKIVKFCTSDPSELDSLKKVLEGLPIEYGVYDSNGNYSLSDHLEGYHSLLIFPGSQELFIYVDPTNNAPRDINELRNNIVPLRLGVKMRPSVKIEVYDSKKLGKVVSVFTNKSPVLYFLFWNGPIVGDFETLEVGTDLSNLSDEEITKERP